MSKIQIIILKKLCFKGVWTGAWGENFKNIFFTSKFKKTPQKYKKKIFKFKEVCPGVKSIILPLLHFSNLFYMEGSHQNEIFTKLRFLLFKNKNIFLQI